MRVLPRTTIAHPPVLKRNIDRYPVIANDIPFFVPSFTLTIAPTDKFARNRE